MIVRTSLARLEQLDIGDQALCFGRIDRSATDVAQPTQPPQAAEPTQPPEAAQGPGLRSHRSLRTGRTARFCHPARSGVFHIGRLGVSGDDLEPLVVDWRAPVAEPFYRATGRDPMGLVLRRHIAAEGPRVTEIEDERFGLFDSARRISRCRRPGIASAGDPASPGAGGGDAGAAGPHDGGASSATTFRSEARARFWLRSREPERAGCATSSPRSRASRMRSSAPSSRGSSWSRAEPGTGKTAVALHRAAYLLYTHRFPLERQGVLVIGPNPLFLRYIEKVLPSLGESGVTLSTISGLVHGLGIRGDDSPEVARLKGDARMARVVARAVRTRQRPLGNRTVDIPFGAAVLHLTPELTPRWSPLGPPAPRDPQCEAEVRRAAPHPPAR